MRIFRTRNKPDQPISWRVVKIVESGVGPYSVTQVTGSRGECERMATRLQVQTGGNFQAVLR